MTLTLSIEGGNLIGSYILGTDDPVGISGNVNGGVFTFDVPNSGPAIPECSGWDVGASATLNPAATTMNLEFIGTFCGVGGGKQGRFFALLTKL